MCLPVGGQNVCFHGSKSQGLAPKLIAETLCFFLGQRITCRIAGLRALCIQPRKKRKQLKGSRQHRERTILTKYWLEFSKEFGGNTMRISNITVRPLKFPPV